MNAVGSVECKDTSLGGLLNSPIVLWEGEVVKKRRYDGKKGVVMILFVTGVWFPETE